MGVERTARTDKILVADDDPAIRALITKALLELKADILQAADGQEALDVARRELPDLILLDNNMPRSAGLDVAFKLRQDDRLMSTPVVILSSDLPPRASDVGVPPYDLWIGKPFDVLKLREQLVKLASRKKRETPLPDRKLPPDPAPGAP